MGYVPVDLADLGNVSSSTPTSGQALVYNSTSGVWEPGGASGIAFVGAKVRLTASQSLGTATFDPIAFDTEDFDSNGFWTSGTPSKFVVPSGQAGKYDVVLFTKIVNSTDVLNQITVNGTEVGGWRHYAPNAADDPWGTAVAVADLSVADEVQALARSGPASASVGVNSSFAIVKLD